MTFGELGTVALGGYVLVLTGIAEVAHALVDQPQQRSGLQRITIHASYQLTAASKGVGIHLHLDARCVGDPDQLDADRLLRGL